MYLLQHNFIHSFPSCTYITPSHYHPHHHTRPSHYITLTIKLSHYHKYHPHSHCLFKLLILPFLHNVGIYCTLTSRTLMHALYFDHFLYFICTHYVLSPWPFLILLSARHQSGIEMRTLEGCDGSCCLMVHVVSSEDFWSLRWWMDIETLTTPIHLYIIIHMNSSCFLWKNFMNRIILIDNSHAIQYLDWMIIRTRITNEKKTLMNCCNNNEEYPIFVTLGCFSTSLTYSMC